MTTLSSFQTAAQSTLPDWVRARALSIYVLVLFGGLAGGSFLWGVVATQLGTDKALLLASVGLLASLVVMLAYRLPEQEVDLSPSKHWADPTLEMHLKGGRRPGHGDGRVPGRNERVGAICFGHR